MFVSIVPAPPHRLIQPDQYREYTLDEGIVVSNHIHQCTLTVYSWENEHICQCMANMWYA